MIASITLLPKNSKRLGNATDERGWINQDRMEFAVMIHSSVHNKEMRLGRDPHPHFFHKLQTNTTIEPLLGQEYEDVLLQQPS